ncbi:MAG TPA: hypothetical protein VIM73_03445 [Polyangiaceae bacterium]
MASRQRASAVVLFSGADHRYCVDSKVATGAGLQLLPPSEGPALKSKALAIAPVEPATGAGP